VQRREERQPQLAGPAKRSGMGVIVGLTVTLLVAAAGVAYFFLGGQLN
jgi:hypothetical protein